MRLFVKLLVLVLFASTTSAVRKRALQKSHEKPQPVKWAEAFLGRDLQFDQIPSLVNLLNKIALEYLSGCHTIILYDSVVEESDGLILQRLLKSFPLDYIHGTISSNYRISSIDILNTSDKCVNYVIFMADVMRCLDVIGEQNTRKIVVVARSSQWRVHEFLASEVSRTLVNLLVITKSDKIVALGQESPYILYTHKLYTDGIGSSMPVVLTSWRNNKFTRSHISLFPHKISEGFAGHRFIISLSHQPPYVIKRGSDENEEVQWDGIEVRLMILLSKIYNFTTDFREGADTEALGSTDAVVKDVQRGKANIGIAGMYNTLEKLGKVDMSSYHSEDCSAFVSLTSTALPRYRAIMGPFHWTVWMTLTIVYLFAIFPLTFSDKHTLKNLLETPEEMENMFWYVFGTFTNCFTFSGKTSWNKSSKIATRLLIGFYWLFTIIITACYTGSIIAFVTLPVYPATIDSVKQLLDGGYAIGTLDKGGWMYWYENVTDPIATKLLNKVEYVPTIELGLKNTTKAFFWPYAFLASRAHLDFIIRTNFSTSSKRSVLHISEECLARYSISVAFAKHSVYKSVIDIGILWAVQSGFIIKLTHDIEWNLMRSDTGKLLQASAGSKVKALKVEDRALALDDTQGMFLLLGAGFLCGAAALLSEWLGGCFNFCKGKKRQRSDSIASNPRSYDVPTPREKLDSLKYNSIIENHVNSAINEQAFGAFGHVSENIEENYVECTVHKNASMESDDIDYEIDRLFNLDEYMGERTEITEQSRQTEELVDNASLNCLVQSKDADKQ